MTMAASIAEVAALVGDPGRANMLDALMDGRALTATELAHAAGVSAATASGHLARMTQGGLLAAVSQGRCRYYRLASRQVARMLESIALVAGPPPACRRATPRVPRALREARTCYDHLAGRVGVALADALVARGAMVLTQDAGEVTASGRALLRAFGIAVDAPRPTRRLYCRPCLDWSERRPHLAGVLGAAMLERALELGWVARRSGGRALDVTTQGRKGLADVFGIDFAS